MGGKYDKGQITAIFAGSMTGDFLPLQLVYKGKTECCLPQWIPWIPTHHLNLNFLIF